MSFRTDAEPAAGDLTRAPPLRDELRSVGERLSVLFVTPFLPSPPQFGAQRRLHELISGVAAAHDVSVLSLVDPHEKQAEAVLATEEYCQRVVAVSSAAYGASRARKRLLQLASLASPHSHQWLGHNEKSFQAALEQLLSHRYDVVQFELAPMAGYAMARGLRHETRPLLCLDEHNIEYDIVKRTAGADSSPVRRTYSAIEWRKVRREERHAWSHLDGCTVTSVRDQEMLLADEPSTRTAVVPNGVDLEFFRPSHPPRPEGDDVPRTLLFFGAIDYYPNTDAVLFFLRDVLPRLTARYPRLRLCVVGRKPPESIVAQRGANVEVTGVVEDVRPWIERADVVIVPLRIGGGTRLKILEAMAMGKAVVSTTLGAEGLDVVPERDLLVANDAEAFVSQVGRLLDDPTLGRRIGTSARQLVASRYSWTAAVQRLTGFYEELLEARAARHET